MRIAIGSDHNGFKLKEALLSYLVRRGLSCYDIGTHCEEPVDYPMIALVAAQGVKAGRYDRAILVCGTGIGMAIAANKIPGVYAAACNDIESAVASRRSNNTQVLALGARFLSVQRSKMIVDAWLDTGFGGRASERKLRDVKRIEMRYLLCLHASQAPQAATVIQDYDGFHTNLMRHVIEFFETGSPSFPGELAMALVAVLECADKSLASGGQGIEAVFEVERGKRGLLDLPQLPNLKRVRVPEP